MELCGDAFLGGNGGKHEQTIYVCLRNEFRRRPVLDFVRAVENLPRSLEEALRREVKRMNALDDEQITPRILLERIIDAALDAAGAPP